MPCQRRGSKLLVIMNLVKRFLNLEGNLTPGHDLVSSIEAFGKRKKLLEEFVLILASI